MIKALRVSSKDNVAVLLEDIREGEKCNYGGRYPQKANQDIPFGHKIALKDIKAGENIIKYEHVIGYATQPIKQGDWVHNHNIRSDRGRVKKERLVL